MPQEGTNPRQGRMPKYRGKTGLFGRLPISEQNENILRCDLFLCSVRHKIRNTVNIQDLESV